MLKLIIRLQEIKDQLDSGNFSEEEVIVISKEFQEIKTKILYSKFAFENIKCFINTIEEKLKILKSLFNN